MTGFIIGCITGGCIGIMVMCLCITAGNADNDIKYTYSAGYIC